MVQLVVCNVVMVCKFEYNGYETYCPYPISFIYLMVRTQKHYGLDVKNWCVGTWCLACCNAVCMYHVIELCHFKLGSIWKIFFLSCIWRLRWFLWLELLYAVWACRGNPLVGKRSSWTMTINPYIQDPLLTDIMLFKL